MQRIIEDSAPQGLGREYLSNRLRTCDHHLKVEVDVKITDVQIRFLERIGALEAS